MDTPVLADQQKNVHSSTLCGHWVPCRGHVKSSRQQGRMARESQGNPWYQHDLMMMMIMMIVLHPNIFHSLNVTTISRYRLYIILTARLFLIR